MLADVQVEGTPLERQLTTFGHRIARWIAAFGVVLVVAGVGVEGIDKFDEVLLFAVAVAVAAVPEGLPSVLTLTLALGTERMAGRKAVVRRLAAVEALGSVTVIATDKTGTLTENSMSVKALDVADEARALSAIVIASDAETGGVSGDPLERGLYAFAARRGVDVERLRDDSPHLSVRPFDAQWRFMRATVRDDDRIISYVKGAPEVVLDRCDLTADERSTWTQRIQESAARGFRVLGLAWTLGESETHMTWIGTVSLWDPPRAEVAGAIEEACGAGIRVVMGTGDHPATATAVARSVGIAADNVVTGVEFDGWSDADRADHIRNVDVFARVSPETKLALVEALREDGEIVAMTGDGVNDAPALKRADIGVAMGQRGSDVSREVADLVLVDDNFATITAAVEEGRSIYANILKFLRFLFSTKVALVLLIALGVTGAALVGLRDDSGGLLVPLIAVQLLWTNIIADGPPALALGVDRNAGMLRQPPRPPTAPPSHPTGYSVHSDDGISQGTDRSRPLLRPSGTGLLGRCDPDWCVPVRVPRTVGLRLSCAPDHVQATSQPYAERHHRCERGVAVADRDDARTTRRPRIGSARHHSLGVGRIRSSRHDRRCRDMVQKDGEAR